MDKVGFIILIVNVFKYMIKVLEHGIRKITCPNCKAKLQYEQEDIQIERKSLDFAFDEDEIQNALAERKNRLEAQKSRDMSRAATKQTPPKTTKNGFTDLGF